MATRSDPVSSGVLPGGSHYLAVGDGPPLVRVLAFTPTHAESTGMERRRALSSAKPLSGDFRVYIVKLKQGLMPGESMSDIAGHLATAIETEFGDSVPVTGTSTGGSVALQMAVDRPDLVRSLVLIASAYRLGPRGRQIQQDLARLTREGKGAEGWARMTAAMAPPRLRGPVYPLARVMMGSMAPEDPVDLLITLDAEDRFDVGERLDRVTAPALVIGGAKDVLYSRELFEETAAGVRDGRVHIYPDRGHMRTSSASDVANLALGFLLATGRG